MIVAEASGPLRPDPDTIFEFLVWWFHYCTRGVVEIGSIVPGTRSLSVFKRFELTDLENAAEYAARTNAQPGASVYFRASTIDPAAPSSGARDIDVLQSPGLWSDHDNEAAVAALSTNRLPVEPSARVVTGRTPHLRIQAFWRLEEPLTDLETVRSLNKKLVAIFGCDSATCNPSRLMRLPGTIAWPIKAGRTIAELTTWHRAENHVDVISLHQIEPILQKSAETNPTHESQLPSDVAAWPTSGVPVAQLLRDFRRPGLWHTSVLRLVAHWIGRGWSDAEIFATAPYLTLPGYTVEETCRDLATMIKGGREKWNVPNPNPVWEPEAEQGGPAQPAIWVDAGIWDETSIPKRPWIAHGYLMRGAVSCLSGRSSGGKSSLVVCWTIALATGKTIGEFSPSSPSIVVNYNVEDDQDEQRRRYSAALKSMGKTPADIANRVIRCGPRNIGTLFERDPNTGQIILTKALESLEQLIVENKGDVLICDPLAELHNADENDNTAMRAIIAAFRGIAQRLGIAVLIVHHDRKGANIPGDMDRLRGASAITGAVRVLLTLTGMTLEEADKFGIDPAERRRYFRIDGAKSNYAPAQEAEWWRLDGYELENGDCVAACLPWTPPGPFDGLSMADSVALLDFIAAGTNGCPYGSKGSAKAELIEALMNRFGARMNLTKEKINSILAAFVKSGVLFEADNQPSPNSRHPRRGYIVESETVSRMRQQIWEHKDAE